MSEATRRHSAVPADRERPRALVLLLLAAALWSLGGILIKSVQWHPMAISGVRSAIAAILIRLVYRRMALAWSVDLVGGAVAYACTVITFVAANKMTAAANVILLQYTAPIYAALFGAWFLGERTSLLDWATILLAFLGMALFFFDRLTAEGFYGNIVALGSGLSYGWLALFLRRQKSGSPVESVFLGNVLAATAGIPFFFLRPLPAGTDWALLAVLGVVQLGLPYILFSIAIRHVSAVEALLIPMIEPILNPLWAFLLLGEVPGRYSLLGGAFILGSVAARGALPHLLRARRR